MCSRPLKEDKLDALILAHQGVSLFVVGLLAAALYMFATVMLTVSLQHYLPRFANVEAAIHALECSLQLSQEAQNAYWRYVVAEANELCDVVEGESNFFSMFGIVLVSCCFCFYCSRKRGFVIGRSVIRMDTIRCLLAALIGLIIALVPWHMTSSCFQLGVAKSLFATRLSVVDLQAACCALRRIKTIFFIYTFGTIVIFPIPMFVVFFHRILNIRMFATNDGSECVRNQQCRH